MAADLTVPASRFTGLPAGLRAEWEGLSGVVVHRPHGPSLLTDETFVLLDPTSGALDRVHVDLSAPPVGEDGPAWLDAMGWAVEMLGRRVGAGLCARADLMRVIGVEALVLYGSGKSRILHGPACDAGYVEGIASHGRMLPHWPDLTGLDDDTAVRAVVAAALRGTDPR